MPDLGRLACRLIGHRWGAWRYGGTGAWTGYVEIRRCVRCSSEEIVQVPQ